MRASVISPFFARYIVTDRISSPGMRSCASISPVKPASTRRVMSASSSSRESTSYSFFLPGIDKALCSAESAGLTMIG